MRCHSLEILQSTPRLDVSVPSEIVLPGGPESLAANRHGAGQLVQSPLDTRVETDDEIVDAEPFVRVDHAGQLTGERPAAGLAGISQLAVHSYGAAQGGRVAAFGLQRGAQAGQPLAQPLVG